METNFNFKSQICTSREQSERLLALGLKKKTADMYYRTNWINAVAANDGIDLYEDDVIPAWSLHRLLSMLPNDAPKIYWILDGASITIGFEDDDTNFFYHKGDIYKGVVDCIEWLIQEGHCNKEYLA